jgi:hypothetical protein
MVWYPVAATKRANCAFVTSWRSIQKPLTVTWWVGRSSGHSRSSPIVKVPPRIRTMPARGPSSSGSPL